MGIGEYIRVLRRGFMAQAAPSVLQGALVELLQPVTIEEAVKWVNNNTSLWDTLSPEQREGLKMIAQETGRLDWLKADWVIGAVKEDCPALASLFLGWRKAHNWLVRQVEIILREIEV